MSGRYARFLLILMAALFMLGACSRKPAWKTVEYDEEVRLSDGSMIWVHITKHYKRVGEPFKKPGYMLRGSEITWDTGFEGVGKKTVTFSTEADFIDKFDGKWYILGGKYSCTQANGKKGVYIDGECSDDIGTRIRYSAYFYVIDQKGNFLVNQDIEKLSNPKYVYNILDHRMLPGVSNPPVEFHGKSISWKEKKEFQKVERMYGKSFETPIRKPKQ